MGVQQQSLALGILVGLSKETRQMEVLEFVAQVNDTLPRALLWQEMRPCKKRRKCPVLCGGPEAAAGDDVTSASVRASERASEFQFQGLCHG